RVEDDRHRSRLVAWRGPVSRRLRQQPVPGSTRGVRDVQCRTEQPACSRGVDRGARARHPRLRPARRLAPARFARRGAAESPVLVAPVQGMGVNLPPDGYLQGAQELCRRYGTLFAVDEVQTGFGRTGRLFAFEHWGLEPDLVTVAKSLSGGYVPVGALLMARR